ncbi:MAG: hypothetical protein R6X07_07345 [Desulfatiglandales bacterium]
MIAAEYEAIQLYMQLAESTDNKIAIEVLHDIADENVFTQGSFSDCSANWLQTKKNSMQKGLKRLKRKSRSQSRKVPTDHPTHQIQQTSLRGVRREL